MHFSFNYCISAPTTLLMLNIFQLHLLVLCISVRTNVFQLHLCYILLCYTVFQLQQPILCYMYFSYSCQCYVFQLELMYFSSTCVMFFGFNYCIAATTTYFMLYIFQLHLLVFTFQLKLMYFSSTCVMHFSFNYCIAATTTLLML